MIERVVIGWDGTRSAAEGADWRHDGARAAARGMLLSSLSRNILLDIGAPTLVAGLPVGRQHRASDLAVRYAADSRHSEGG